MTGTITLTGTGNIGFRKEVDSREYPEGIERLEDLEKLEGLEGLENLYILDIPEDLYILENLKRVENADGFVYLAWVVFGFN